jgi:hypothetical protein
MDLNASEKWLVNHILNDGWSEYDFYPSMDEDDWKLLEQWIENDWVSHTYDEYEEDVFTIKNQELIDATGGSQDD